MFIFGRFGMVQSKTQSIRRTDAHTSQHITALIMKFTTSSSEVTHYNKGARRSNQRGRRRLSTMMRITASFATATKAAARTRAAAGVGGGIQSSTTSGVRGMATKKAGGSTNNGRDSAGRRLGVKLLHNQYAKAGSILVRQRGQKYKAGDNVGIGKDHTLFAKQEGLIRYEKIRLNYGTSSKKRIRSVVHVDTPQVDTQKVDIVAATAML
jgi:large subunit ribosomal protein L27